MISLSLCIEAKLISRTHTTLCKQPSTTTLLCDAKT